MIYTAGGKWWSYLDSLGLPGNRQKEYFEKIQELSLMDDEFMTKCLEDSKECVELVLHILMGRDDLKVLSAQTQYTVKNLQGRSVRLDVFAADDNGRRYNIEIQREGRGAGSKRARYHSSILDANLLLAGEDFEKLPETYVIFITQKDVLKKGLPLYRVERCVLETNEAFGDGSHIMYVNGEYRDDTPLGRLMHDFSCTDPNDMNYQVLAEKTKFFKEDTEGVRIMSRILEDMRNEALEEGRMEGKREGVLDTVRCLVVDGTLSLEKIASIAGLTYDEVKAIAENK